MKQNKYKGKKGRTVSPWVMGGLIMLVVVLVLVVAQALRNKSAAESVQAGTPGLPKEISVTEAAQKRTEGALMLDVREQSEWDEFHMPDARLIPLAQLESRLNDLPRDREIVVVCRSGNRSQQGRDILLQAGFTSVTSMAGGMKDWQANGFPTVTGP